LPDDSCAWVRLEAVAVADHHGHEARRARTASSKASAVSDTC
jgi:hypothetical protein